MESAEFMELKLISCQHLKAFNFFQKLSVYAVVSMVSDESKNAPQKQKIQCFQRQKTGVDREGNGNPEWNQQLRFDLKDISSLAHHHFVKFSLRSEGIVYGNKTIGEVCVPLKDLIDEFNRAVRFVSYQVRTTDGKPNGVLNFSYKVKKKLPEAEDKPHLPPPPPPPLPPSIQVEEYFNVPKKDSIYPSLDVSVSALPAISLSTPYHRIQAPPPPLPVSMVIMGGDGAYYHPRPVVYASQPCNYDHGLCRYPSAVDAVDGDGWRMGLGAPGSWTFR